ncbi:MAG: hypothetical protein WA324_25315, partial [Bryobacteraceae bacterium]
MFSLRLQCAAQDVDRLSGELWDLGAVGIQEFDYDESVVLAIAFETEENKKALLDRYALFSPDWEQLEETDWVAHTQRSWPPRAIGE